MTLEKYIENFKTRYLESVKLPDDEKENYELKKLGNKNNDECLYFSEKEFEKYQEEHDTQIIGNVRVRQKKYKDPEKAQDTGKAYEKKYKNNVVGVCKLKLTDDYYDKHSDKLDETYRSYDLYKSDRKSVV